MLLFPVLSWMLYTLLPKRKRKTVDTLIPNDYGVIVTAYKHTGNLTHVIDSLLAMDHPNFHVYVVADNCEPYAYPGSPTAVTILQPQPPLTNQVRSHFYAVEHFVRPHNRIVIIDSDNLADPNMLSAFNPYFDAGYEAVQGVRAAKNINTPLAALDAVNEMYYLFYDRKVLFGIGSSSMLSGSGMAFTTELYQQCLGNSNSSGAGFDKVLQYAILKQNKRIAFAPEAVVLDEKTAHADQLVKQRARWNNTWFRFFPFSLKLMARGIFGFSFNQLFFGFVLFRLPLFMLISLVAVTVIINFFVNPIYNLYWLGAIALFAIGFLLALKKMKAPRELYEALMHIPKFFILQLRSLFKARKANQYSVATEHQYHEPGVKDDQAKKNKKQGDE